MSFVAIYTANIALPHSSLAITGDAFCHFYMYDTPTFKTDALEFVLLPVVSNEGRVNVFCCCIYKQLI